LDRFFGSEKESGLYGGAGTRERMAEKVWEGLGYVFKQLWEA